MLTDGAVVIYGDGSESKRFHIRDGIALVWAQRAGLTVGLLSARQSPTTAQRAAQLGITLVHQGVSSKIDTYDQIVGDMVLTDTQVAYMGDDIVDLAVLRRVGLSAAPVNAVNMLWFRPKSPTLTSHSCIMPLTFGWPPTGISS